MSDFLTFFLLFTIASFGNLLHNISNEQRKVIRKLENVHHKKINADNAVVFNNTGVNCTTCRYKGLTSAGIDTSSPDSSCTSAQNMQFLVIALILHGTMADLLGNPSGFYQPASPPVAHQPAPSPQGGQYPAKRESLYQPIPYAYNYVVNDDNTGTNFAQNEQSDGHRTHGSYTVALPDGRIQHVAYSVDPESGYHAEVTYEGEATFDDAYRTARNRPAPTSELPSAYPGSARARSFKSASERSFPLVFRADARGKPAQKELSEKVDKTNDFISPFKSGALARLQNRLASSGLVIFAPKHEPQRVHDISRTVTSPPSHTVAPVFTPSRVYQHQFRPIIPYQSNPTSAVQDRYLVNDHTPAGTLQPAARSGSVLQ